MKIFEYEAFGLELSGAVVKAPNSIWFKGTATLKGRSRDIDLVYVPDLKNGNIEVKMGLMNLSLLSEIIETISKCINYKHHNNLKTKLMEVFSE